MKVKKQNGCEVQNHCKYEEVVYPPHPMAGSLPLPSITRMCACQGASVMSDSLQSYG